MLVLPRCLDMYALKQSSQTLVMGVAEFGGKGGIGRAASTPLWPCVVAAAVDCCLADRDRCHLHCCIVEIAALRGIYHLVVYHPIGGMLHKLQRTRQSLPGAFVGPERVCVALSAVDSTVHVVRSIGIRRMVGSDNDDNSL